MVSSQAQVWIWSQVTVGGLPHPQSVQHQHLTCLLAGHVYCVQYCVFPTCFNTCNNCPQGNILASKLHHYCPSRTEKCTHKWECIVQVKSVTDIHTYIHTYKHKVITHHQFAALLNSSAIMYVVCYAAWGGR